MKKILFSVLVCTVAFGQNSGKVANTIMGLQKGNVQFKKYSLFTAKPDMLPAKYIGIVQKATIASLDLSKANAIAISENSQLEIEIPYLGEMIRVLLYKVEIRSEGFHADTDKAKNIVTEKGVHYRGIINGDVNSLVSFNFFRNQVNGMISNEEYGNIVIGKLNIRDNLTEYIIYSDRQLKTQNNFTCAPSEIMPKTLPDVTQSRETSLTGNCVTVYFEIDYDLYTANGSDLNQTMVWINSAFNNVQALYDNDQIKVALRSVYIWTSPDPYAGATVYGNLYQFKDVRPYFDGDIGQLLTTGTGFGGVAAVVGGLCSENNFCYSDVFLAYSDIPVYSWTIQSITHELGHLMGSPHTHDCLWNGNNTPIDGCGPAIGYPGLTATGDTCSITTGNPANGGTIMSYCYAVTGVGNNFANGFGPQPAARITQYIEASDCLGSDCISTCIASVSNVSVSNLVMASATLSWTEANPANNTSWQVAAAAYPFIPTVWTTVSLIPEYVFNDLDPNTYYTFFVRNNCGDLEGASKSSGIMATPDEYCSGRPFTDTGGLLNNYGDNQDWTRIISPLFTTDAAVKITFSSIDIENGYDFLHIYNGQGTGGTELVPGGITGNTVVGPFTSTDGSGSLTFRFVSDTNTNSAGWDAAFDCESLGINENEVLDLTYYPNPVKNEITIASKSEIRKITIFSIDGKLLFEEDSRQFNTKIDMSGYARGTYIFKLQFENKPITFKVIRQ